MMQQQNFLVETKKKQKKNVIRPGLIKFRQVKKKNVKVDSNQGGLS